jgi:hypothetical protein
MFYLKIYKCNAAIYIIVTAFFPGLNSPKRGANHSATYSAKGAMAWNCAFLYFFHPFTLLYLHRNVIG